LRTEFAEPPDESFLSILTLAASCFLLPASCFLLFIAGAMAQPKRVTILQSYGVAFKPWSEYAKALGQELESQSPWPLEVQEFAVSTARSDDVTAESQFARYLDAIYPTDKPDLIVACAIEARHLLGWQSLCERGSLKVREKALNLSFQRLPQ
jgi:hypothetical protein